MKLSDDQSYFSSGSREILLSLYNTFYDIEQRKITCTNEVYIYYYYFIFIYSYSILIFY